MAFMDYIGNDIDKIIHFSLIRDGSNDSIKGSQESSLYFFTEMKMFCISALKRYHRQGTTDFNINTISRICDYPMPNELIKTITSLPKIMQVLDTAVIGIGIPLFSSTFIRNYPMTLFDSIIRQAQKLSDIDKMVLNLDAKTKQLDEANSIIKTLTAQNESMKTEMESMRKELDELKEFKQLLLLIQKK